MRLPCVPGQSGPIDLDYSTDGVDLTVFERDTMPEAAVALESAAALLVRAQSLDSYSVCLQLAFYEAGQRERGEDPTLRAVFGILPGVEVPVPFDFTWLDGQTLFAPRTLGRLKMTLFGKRIRRADIASIVLSATPGFPGRRLRLWPCELLDDMPQIDIPAKPLIDELGQWLPGEWPGKVPGRAACTARLNTMADSADPDEKRGEIANGPDLHESTHEINDDVVRHAVDHPYAAFPVWDRFGGWTGRRFEATGWFRVERETNPDGAPGRFWLVDPEGGAFLSTGVDCVGAGIQTRLDPMRPWLDAHAAGLLDRTIAKSESGDGGNTDAIDGTDDIATDFGDPSFSWRHDPAGCNGVNASYDYGQANLRAAFGDDWYEAWTRITRNHLTDWGVNTIGNWSDRRFIRRAGIPYVLPADELNGGFPKTELMLFRDFPDVFSPEYARDAERYAQGLLPWKDETNLIGYFMRNEPNWAFVYDLNIAEEMLANPADLVSKRRFVEWLKARYNGEVDALNAAWAASFASFDAIIAEPRFRLATALPGSLDDLRAFSTLLIDRYVRVPAEALRRVDPHHLNLGMRYAYITDRSLLAGADCYDVFSINSYQRTAYDQVEQVGRMLDMPVMVGEFHHGALDRGLTAHGIRGVTTQTERGVAYRYYVEQAARSPYFVGAHYFQYNDQSPLGRFDGENYQIGLVDVCMQKYPEMAEAMRACHRSLYEVAAGERGAFDRIPEEINPIHY
ncbi:beta-galactosidase [Bifidobacterium callitrichos]|uniref:Beta-agarase n=1 Tax=Bifidobacterium callitrichos DSM 23973 TaxID=1437609 RepID=A0A086ZY14_9BIFI|nr:beta-galactosidase [Bifidobacterium callitrichos]KFI51414.1 beta-agarase [Bifidobacterium callitrichos DSM 23973]